MLGQASRPNPHIVRFFDHASTDAPVARRGRPDRAALHGARVRARADARAVCCSSSGGTGLPLDRVRRIGRQVALALEDVHAQKVVHRDLKPSNVLLANEGGTEVAKVTDFGLVKAVDIGSRANDGARRGEPRLRPARAVRAGQPARRPAHRRLLVRRDAVRDAHGRDARFPTATARTRWSSSRACSTGRVPACCARPAHLPPELAARAGSRRASDSRCSCGPRPRSPSSGTRRSPSSGATVEPLLRAASERRSRGAGGSRHPVDPRTGAVGFDETLETTAQQKPAAEADPQLANPAAWKWRVRVPSVRGGRGARGGVRSVGRDGDGPGGGGASALDRRLVVASDRAGGAGHAAGARARVGAPGRARGVRRARARGPLPARPGSERLGHARQGGDLPRRAPRPAGHDVTLVGERPAAARSAGVGPRVDGGHHRPVRARQAHAAVGRDVVHAPARGDAPSLGRRRGVRRLGHHRAARAGRARARGVGVRRASARHRVAARRRGGHGGRGGPRALAFAASSRRSSRPCRPRAICSRSRSTPAGVAWGGSAQARLLRRTAGSWVRMSGELGAAVVGRRRSGSRRAWSAPSATTARWSRGSWPEMATASADPREDTPDRPSHHRARRRARIGRFLWILASITAAMHVPVALGVGELARRLGAPHPWLLGAAWGAVGAALFVSRMRAGMPDNPRHPAIVRLVDIPYFVHWCAALWTLIPALVASLVVPVVELARGVPGRRSRRRVHVDVPVRARRRRVRHPRSGVAGSASSTAR